MPSIRLQFVASKHWKSSAYTVRADMLESLPTSSKITRAVVSLVGFNLLLGMAISAASAGDSVQLTFPDNAATLSALRPLLMLKKDQYETTAAFTKRVCSATLDALKSSNGKRALLRLNAKDATRNTYDADRQAFDFQVSTYVHGSSGEPYEDRWKWEPPTWNPIVVNGTPERGYSSYSYDAAELASSYQEHSNGKMRSAIKVNFQEKAILFFLARPDRTIRLPAKPDQARNLSGDLQLAFSTKIKPPCFVTGAKHTSPTRDNPYDSTVKVLGLVGEDTEWLILKASTMEVLKRGKFR